MRAGHEMIGVDVVDHSGVYPGEFLLGDAVTFIREFGRGFDFIHASPPCQAWTRGNAAWRAGGVNPHPRLIGETREALEGTGRPWVLENVAGAREEMRDPVLLCGKMFGLRARDEDGTELIMYRHRLFETGGGLRLVEMGHVRHQSRRVLDGRGVWVAGAYGGARRDRLEARYVRRGGYVPRSVSVLRELMGVDHIWDERGLFEALPPAYTEFIGYHLR